MKTSSNRSLIEFDIYKCVSQYYYEGHTFEVGDIVILANVTTDPLVVKTYSEGYYHIPKEALYANFKYMPWHFEEVSGKDSQTSDYQEAYAEVKGINDLPTITCGDEKVNHPSHYTWLKDKCGIEVIDITRHMDFCLGNAVKYLLRAGHKSEQGYSDKEKQVEDLRKAVWYINDKIAQLQDTKA